MRYCLLHGVGVVRSCNLRLISDWSSSDVMVRLSFAFLALFLFLSEHGAVGESPPTPNTSVDHQVASKMFAVGYIVSKLWHRSETYFKYPVQRKTTTSPKNYLVGYWNQSSSHRLILFLVFTPCKRLLRDITVYHRTPLCFLFSSVPMEPRAASTNSSIIVFITRVVNISLIKVLVEAEMILKGESLPFYEVLLIHIHF